jgi:HAD superfamily hydrolase (TIGR01509 family)
VIFFDVGNTLLFPDWDTILAPVAEHRPAPHIEQLRALERRTKREFDAVMLQQKQTNFGFWRMFHTYMLADLDLSDEALLNQLTLAMADSSNWNQSRPGTHQALESIAKSYRVGVISNADGKIAGVLERCGIADCFLTVTDSGIVGHEKPHPAIFKAACREMNTQPQECLYVGDVYSVDYFGATQAGMDAVLFDVAGAYHENGLPRVESLQGLQTWLRE